MDPPYSLAWYPHISVTVDVMSVAGGPRKPPEHNQKWLLVDSWGFWIPSYSFNYLQNSVSAVGLGTHAWQISRAHCIIALVFCLSIQSSLQLTILEYFFKLRVIQPSYSQLLVVPFSSWISWPGISSAFPENTYLKQLHIVGLLGLWMAVLL